MNSLFDLTDRIAVVTGGGHGIGREIVRTLAKASAHICIAEQDPKIGEEAMQEVREIGRNALPINKFDRRWRLGRLVAHRRTLS
jgi:7-alpha-hydroxysteroid dehydrogenase